MSEPGTRAVDEPLTLDAFRDHVGTRFSLPLDADEPLELELAAATPVGASDPPRASGGRRQPFSLLFLGPSNEVLPQSIYPLQHASLGELQVFLVPIGPDPDGRGMQYEAIFN